MEFQECLGGIYLAPTQLEIVTVGWTLKAAPQGISATPCEHVIPAQIPLWSSCSRAVVMATRKTVPYLPVCDSRPCVCHSLLVRCTAELSSLLRRHRLVIDVTNMMPSAPSQETEKVFLFSRWLHPPQSKHPTLKLRLLQTWDTPSPRSKGTSPESHPPLTGMMLRFHISEAFPSHWPLP